MSESNPSLSKVIEDTVDAKLSRLNTMMPGKIVKVDNAAGKCDVQPQLQGKFGDGTLFDYPVISNCPIATLRAGKAFISVPLHVGDSVEIRFCQRSLDIWLAKGGLVDPKDARKHALSDAVVYPGLYPFSDPPAGASGEDIIMKNDAGMVTVGPDGKIVFKNNGGSVTLGADGKYSIKTGGDELIDLIIQLAEKLALTDDKISQITTITMLGAQAPLNAAEFVAIKGDVDTIKGKLTGLKG